MDKERAREIAENLINRYCPNYPFGFDKAKQRLGQCNYLKKRITLSEIAVELNEEDKIKDTILHEIAHALNEYQRHNYKWRQTAISIGCTGERTTNANTVEGKYAYKCSNCGAITKYHRIHRKPRACGNCCNKYNHGRFSEKYILIKV